MLRIGLTLPLSAANSADGKGVANAVQLAIDEHPIAGYRVEVVARDYASGGAGADPQKAVWDLDEMATQRQVVGVVGPIDDSVARLEAPETNRAGLLQCSPAVSSAALTQGSQGELLRKANPKRITFVRVSTTVASEGVALARFAYQTLKVRVVGIVAEGDDGTVLADAFTREFTKLGGTTGARWLVQAVGPNNATIREWREIGAGAVLLASDDPEDAQEVATALADAGLRSTALLVGDRVVDVPPDVNARLVEDAGRKLNGIYGALPIVSEAPQLNDFAKRYRGRFGEDPSLHAASGYACAEVVLRAIQAATGRGSVTREAVRAAAVDPRTTHPTIVGPVRFDAVGDLRRRTVSILRVTRDTAWISPWNYTVQVTVAK